MKKIFSLILILLLSLTMIGCSSNKNNKAITKINETLAKVQNTISSVEIISNNTLIISDIMDTDLSPDKNSSEYGNGYDGATFTTAKNINKYVAKLYNLSNTAQNAINANKDTEILISKINSKANDIQNVCSILSKKDCCISQSQTSALNELCSNILLNINRINITKDEIKAETNNLCSVKQNYTNNVDKLSSKYTRLTNCIETRNTYLSNVFNDINNIHSIVLSCCYNEDCANKTHEAWTNIDTYQNANKRTINKTNNKYPTYNDNYYGYGRGGTNPYYNYGAYGIMNRLGGGFNRYPYSPYSNYNPYMPNIDTFGTYTNVDTYENPYKRDKKENLTKENYEKEINNNIDGDTENY